MLMSKCSGEDLAGLLSVFVRGCRRKLLILISVIILVLILGACSAEFFLGEGRGDWTLNLREGYGISKLNSRQILLIHKDNPEDSGAAIVIPNFFVLAYQDFDSYICLKGICTQERAISEEELKAAVFSYYLVDTKDSNIAGPLASYYDLTEYCNLHEIEIGEEWIEAREEA